MDGLTIKCLGSFVVKVDNKIISLEQWKSKKALALFQYLIAKQGEKVSLETIVEVLWPDSTVAMSTNNLYTTVYNLRNTLDPSRTRAHAWIRNSNGLYWLDLSKINYLDLVEFEHNIKLGEEIKQEKPKEAIKSYLQAIQLYRGKFLAEIEHQSWTSVFRECYQRKYITAVIQTAKLLVKYDKDYDEAILLLQNALKKEPFREELYKQIIVYLLEANRSVEAMEKYENYSKMLKSNFGLPPDEQLWQLICNMRQSAATVEGELEQGAFQCNPESLKMIIELEQRRMARHKQPLSLLTINTGTNLVAEITLLTLNILRQGDIVCQYPDRLIVVLPETSRSCVDVVINRFETIMLSKIKTTVPIEFQVIKPRI